MKSLPEEGPSHPADASPSEKIRKVCFCTYTLLFETIRLSTKGWIMVTVKIHSTKYQTVDDIRRTLQDRIGELSEKHGIKSLELFGSYVRGEQKRGSDIDILVEFDQGRSPTLFSFVALEQELSDLLGEKVDLVEKCTLKPGLRNRILQEAVPI